MESREDRNSKRRKVGKSKGERVPTIFAGRKSSKFVVNQSKMDEEIFYKKENIIEVESSHANTR